MSFLTDILKLRLSCNSYNDVLENYSKLEKSSFDYAVLEKANSVAMVSYEGEWKDLGTWNTLTEVMDSVPIGEVKIGRNHDALSGDTYTIPINTLHSLKAVNNTVFMEIQLIEQA